MRGDIGFEEPSGRRFEVALELLREGRAVSYRGLRIQLVAGQTLEIEIPARGAGGEVSSSQLKGLVAAGRSTVRDLCSKAPQFADFVSDLAVQWVVVADWDKGAVELGREGGWQEHVSGDV